MEVMAAIRVQFPDSQTLARVYFDRDCPYPGWYVRYCLKGTRRKLALTVWDPADGEGARAEAASLLHVPADRVDITEPS